MKSLGMVSEKDRELLAKKIKDAVYKDKLNIVTREFSQKNAMVLLFDPLVKTKFNALSIDWETIVAKSELNYILGNPPLEEWLRFLLIFCISNGMM